MIRVEKKNPVWSLNCCKKSDLILNFLLIQVMDSVSVSGGGSYAGAGGAGHYGTYGHYGTAAYQPQTAYMVETTQVPQYMGQVCTLFP